MEIKNDILHKKRMAKCKKKCASSPLASCEHDPLYVGDRGHTKRPHSGQKNALLCMGDGEKETEGWSERGGER